MTRPVSIILVCAGERRQVAIRDALAQAQTAASITPINTTAGLDAALPSADLVILADSLETTLVRLCSAMSAVHPQLPIIVLSPALEDDDVAALLEAGAWDVLDDERGARLRHAVARALRQADDRRIAESVLRARDEHDRELVSERRLLDAALNAAANAMVITDRAGSIVWVNPAFTALTGYGWDEAIGRNHRDMVKSGAHDPAFYEGLWKVIAAGDVWRGEMINRRKDGTRYHEAQTITPVRDASGAISHFIAIKRDLTERRQLEAQFRQSQKMEVIGQLAGGVAHDFNNLLTVIHGYARFITGDAGGGTEGHNGHVDEIIKAAERAAQLTKQLLAFSRRQVMETSTFDVNELIGQLGKMLQRLIGEHIEVRVPSARERLLVTADRGQLEQVLMNLAVNAKDAMPAGGVLEFRTSLVDAGADGPLPEAAKAGPYVAIAVSDSGTGMSEEVRARVFEPFFTTKPPDRGTGLGLSTVYGIVTQSGGHVVVSSQLGSGSTFTVFLPQASKQAERTPVPVAPPQPKPHGGDEVVLLVEDEEPVRMLAGTLLKRGGYSVVEATRPAEATQVFERLEGGVDLLVTDMVMPGGTGAELFLALIEKRAGLRVVFMSGYPEDPALESILSQAGTTFLAKPFTAERLMRTVREVLDREPLPPAA